MHMLTLSGDSLWVGDSYVLANIRIASCGTNMRHPFPVLKPKRTSHQHCCLISAGSVRDTYTLSQDSTQITEDCTSAFLAQLQANPQTAAACNIADVTTFSKVPKDLLNYLRYHRSTVLLPLLRQFCSSGAGQLKLQGVNQKQLKSEISALLNTSALDQYYRTTSNREGTAGVSGRSGSTNVTAKPTRQVSGSLQPGDVKISAGDCMCRSPSAQHNTQSLCLQRTDCLVMHYPGNLHNAGLKFTGVAHACGPLYVMHCRMLYSSRGLPYHAHGMC